MSWSALILYKVAPVVSPPWVPKLVPCLALIRSLWLLLSASEWGSSARHVTDRGAEEVVRGPVMSVSLV